VQTERKGDRERERERERERDYILCIAQKRGESGMGVYSLHVAQPHFCDSQANVVVHILKAANYNCTKGMILDVQLCGCVYAFML